MSGVAANVRAAMLRLALCLVVASPLTVHAQGSDDLEALDSQVQQLYKAGKFAEAQPVAERFLALAKSRHGEDHPATGTAMLELGLIYKSLGRDADAVPLFERTLPLLEKGIGPNDPFVGSVLKSLGEVYRSSGRYADAEPAFIRWL